jgi:hypothetical protein
MGSPPMVLLQIHHAVHGGRRFALQRGLSPTHNSLVGFEFDEHVRPVRLCNTFVQCDAEHLHVRDPQLRPDIPEHVRARRHGFGTLYLKGAPTIL